MINFKLLLSLLFGVTAPCYLAMANEATPAPIPYDNYGQAETPIYSKIPAQGSKELSYSQLLALIEKNKVTTIEELVPLLPENYRRYYTLVYQSRSRQGGTKENPRVILFGPDGRLLISFTGDEKLRGGNVLEIQEWQEDGKEFKFHEIKFEKDQTPHVVEQPTSCVNCHRNNLRPNWETYAAWPGVYGSREFIKEGTGEAVGYRSFLAGKINNPRYKALPVYIEATHGEYLPGISSFLFTVDSSHISTTALFSRYVGVLNFRRIEKIIRDYKQGEPYRRFKYALAAVALGCAKTSDNVDDGRPNIESFFPSSLPLPNSEKNYLDTVKKVEKCIQTDFEDRSNMIAKESGKSDYDTGMGMDGLFYKTIALYQYVLSRMGLNLDDYSMTLERGTYGFATFDSGIDALSRVLIAEAYERHDTDLDFLFKSSKAVSTTSKDELPSFKDILAYYVRDINPDQDTGLSSDHLIGDEKQKMAHCEKLKDLSLRALTPSKSNHPTHQSKPGIAVE